MNCVLIVTNYNAGRKKGIKYKKKVIDFVLKYTKSFKLVDIDELKELDVSPYDTILAMGGDGTVNKVLPYLIDTDKVLGIVPCGTANLLAAKLGLSSNIDKNIKLIRKNNIQNIDVLNINGMPCILRCGLGYDADIICKTPQSLKNKFGYFAYFIAGIIFALRLKQKRYKIHINDKELEKKASCIIFSNASNMYKNFMQVGDNSLLDDGLAEVFILKTTNPIILFFELVKIAFNIHKNSSVAEYIKADKIFIENEWHNCHIDGEKKNLKGDININVESKKVRVFTNRK